MTNILVLTKVHNTKETIITMPAVITDDTVIVDHETSSTAETTITFKPTNRSTSIPFDAVFENLHSKVTNSWDNQQNKRT